MVRWPTIENIVSKTPYYVVNFFNPSECIFRYNYFGLPAVFFIFENKFISSSSVSSDSNSIPYCRQKCRAPHQVDCYHATNAIIIGKEIVFILFSLCCPTVVKESSIAQ